MNLYMNLYILYMNSIYEYLEVALNAFEKLV